MTQPCNNCKKYRETLMRIQSKLEAWSEFHELRFKNSKNPQIEDLNIVQNYNYLIELAYQILKETK